MCTSFFLLKNSFKKFTNFKDSKLNTDFPILWMLFLKEFSLAIRLPFVSFQFCNIRNVDPAFKCLLSQHELHTLEVLADSTFRSLVSLALCAAYRVDGSAHPFLPRFLPILTSNGDHYFLHAFASPYFSDIITIPFAKHYFLL